MNILFIVPYAPTPVRTRPYNLLRAMVRGGHALTLATLWQSEAERDALTALEREGIRVLSAPLTRSRAARNDLRAVFTRSPLQAAHCWQPQLAGCLRALFDRSGRAPADRFDIVHVEHLRGARYGLILKSHVPTLWDSVDCISYLFEQASRHSASRAGRWMARFELGRTRRYEGWLADQFARVLVTSEVDRVALEHLARRTLDAGPAASRRRCGLPSAVKVLPNGVDLDYFRSRDVPRQADTLVLSGKMSYHANVTAALYFAREVLPLIWRERPGVRLCIAGQSPPASVKSLATDSRITVTGYVPDLRDYLARAAVAVCPLVYGAGIQNKVLEAMACATPVVTGSVGASALQAVAGKELLVADRPPEFAASVLRLLRDPQCAERIGRAGRRYVEGHHDWTQVESHLQAYYQEAIETWNTSQPPTQP